jgi:hypothetical protein
MFSYTTYMPTCPNSGRTKKLFQPQSLKFVQAGAIFCSSEAEKNHIKNFVLSMWQPRLQWNSHCWKRLTFANQTNT